MWSNVVMYLFYFIYLQHNEPMRDTMSVYFYVYFSLVMLQFICTLFSDLSARGKLQSRRKKCKDIIDGENQPLINALHYDENNTLPVYTLLIILTYYYVIITNIITIFIYHHYYMFHEAVYSFTYANSIYLHLTLVLSRKYVLSYGPVCLHLTVVLLLHAVCLAICPCMDPPNFGSVTACSVFYYIALYTTT